MKEKIKNLLLRILFRLVDSYGEPIPEDDKAMKHWLEWSAQDIGFIRYCQWRERHLVKGMLVDGIMPTPRDSFIRKSGQRFELHHLMNLAGGLQRKATAKKLEAEWKKEKEAQ